MSAVEDRIQSALQRIVGEYGKVGLLIDDSLEAPTRIARAFYGSEALPRWWMQLCSLEHASCGLDVFQEIFRCREKGRIRGILIFDRYLPAHCGEPPVPAIPWYKADSKLSEEDERAAKAFREKVRNLQSSKLRSRPGAIPAYRMLYMTSFQPISSEPEVSGNSGESFSVSWRGRSVEILQEERRAIQKSEAWRGLLRFGPEKDAPVVREERLPTADLGDAHLAQAKWHAETWQNHLKRIADLLRDGHPVILLTGAGASLASAPTAPGMPSTDALLEEACAQIEKAARKAESREEAVQPLGCACESQSDSQITPRFWKLEESAPKAPIDWLIDEFGQTGSIAGLRCTLEELFSRTLHENLKGRNVFDDFHGAFRSALYRWDYGFAYHHWLLARLPWKGIITTNFDGFHERAAAAAATLPWLRNEKRLEPLRYANPVTWQEGRPAFSLGALFKPYGSLYAPDGKIALSQEEIDGLRNRFKSALDATVEKRIAGAPGALVVLGHSMRDPSIGHLFNTVAELLSFCDIFWVDPSSFERSWKKKDEGSSWERWMWERVLRKGQGGGPVPATALEFACDLWDAFFQT